MSAIEAAILARVGIGPWEDQGGFARAYNTAALEWARDYVRSGCVVYEGPNGEDVGDLLAVLDACYVDEHGAVRLP